MFLDVYVGEILRIEQEGVKTPEAFDRLLVLGAKFFEVVERSKDFEKLCRELKRFKNAAHPDHHRRMDSELASAAFRTCRSLEELNSLIECRPDLLTWEKQAVLDGIARLAPREQLVAVLKKHRLL
jgi:hypothetical protein